MIIIIIITIIIIIIFIIIKYFLSCFNSAKVDNFTTQEMSRLKQLLWRKLTRRYLFLCR